MIFSDYIEGLNNKIKKISNKKQEIALFFLVIIYFFFLFFTFQKYRMDYERGSYPLIAKYLSKEKSFTFMPELNKKINNTFLNLSTPFSFIEIEGKNGLLPASAIGYPFLLSLFFSSFGIEGFFLLNPFLTLSSAILVYLISKKKFGGYKAIISFLIFAFNPSLIESSSMFMAHSSMIFFLLLSYYLILFNKKTSSFFSGLSFSIAFLIRHEAILFLFSYLIINIKEIKKTINENKYFIFGFLPLLSFKIFYTLSNFGLSSGYTRLYAERGIQIKPSLILINFLPRFLTNLKNFIFLISPFLFLLFILGCLNREKDHYALLIILVLFLFLFSIFPASNELPNFSEFLSKDFYPTHTPADFFERIFLPLLPFFCIFTSKIFGSLSEKKVVSLILILLLIPNLSEIFLKSFFVPEHSYQHFFKEKIRVIPPNSLVIIDPNISWEGMGSRTISQGIYVFSSNVYTINSGCYSVAPSTEYNILKNFFLLETIEKAINNNTNVFFLGNKKNCLNIISDYPLTKLEEDFPIWEVKKDV